MNKTDHTNDILIKNGYIITMDPNRKILPDGAIYVKGNKIVAVGKTHKITQKYQSENVIDAKGKAVLPGFVNTHDHLFQVLMKSLGDDLPLMEWSPKIIVPLCESLTAKDCYWAGLSGSIEGIRSGITTHVDMHYTHKDPNSADAIMESYLEVGIRGIESRCVQDNDRFAMFSDNIKAIWEPLDIALKRGREFIHRWKGKGDGRLYPWFGPGAVWTCSDEMISEATALALEENCRFAFHFNETKDEVNGWQKKFNMNPIEYAYKVEPNIGKVVLAIHCVWLNDREITIMKETNMNVSYNPTSNMYLASGIAPINQLVREGITVGLGLDGPASNNGQDMFELIKTGILLQKVGTLDPLALTAEKGLEMATIDGARAIGLESEIGSLEPGKKADLFLYDLSSVNMTALNRIPSQLVYCGKSNDVKTVIIDGQIVLDNGTITTVKEEWVLEQTQKAAEALVTRAGCEEFREIHWKPFVPENH